MKRGTATLTMPGPPLPKPVVTEFEPVPKVQTYESAIEDLIRIRAYEKWESAGRPMGRDLEFWHEAEEELLLGRRPAEAVTV